MSKSDKKIESKIDASCTRMRESLQKLSTALSEWQRSDRRRERKYRGKIRKEYVHLRKEARTIMTLNTEEERINIEIANKTNEIVKQIKNLIEKELK